MNERIKEIATEVGISVEYLNNTKQWSLIEGFAELIIKECIKSIHATTDESIDLGRTLGENASWIENDIKKQFGVE